MDQWGHLDAFGAGAEQRQDSHVFSISIQGMTPGMPSLGVRHGQGRSKRRLLLRLTATSVSCAALLMLVVAGRFLFRRQHERFFWAGTVSRFEV